MSKNQDYIKLPTIQSIEVSNYFLFSKNWSYEVKNGLNLFLGANSLGKTTTAYMIIYGITGPWEDITKTYFTDREHKSLKQNKINQFPTVKIKYNINKTPICIERRLDKPLILDFAIGEKHYYENNVQDIEKLYAKKVTKLFDVENIEDIAFLLRKLLIREEEGNYLLWDKSDQSQVIRLLLNYSKFYKEFRKIEREVKDLDSSKRGTQDIQYQFKERKEHLIAQRDEVINKDKAIKSKKDLSDQINKTSETISKLRKQKEKNLNNINYLKKELNSFDKQGGKRDAHEIMRFYHPSETNGVRKPSAHLFVPPCLPLIGLNPAFHPPQFLKYLLP